MGLGMSDLKYPWALSSHSERLEVEKGRLVGVGDGTVGMGMGGKGLAHKVQGLGVIVRDEIRRRFRSG